MKLKEAVDLAKKFTIDYGNYYNPRLINVKKKQNRWCITFEVGEIITDEIVITVDDESKEIIGYEIISEEE